MDSCIRLFFLVVACVSFTSNHAFAAPQSPVTASNNNNNEDTVPSVVKVPFTRCGGNVDEVRVIGCKDGKVPCIMSRGTTGRIEVDFVPPFDTRSLYAEVRGRVGSGLLPVYIPLSGFHKEACVGHGIRCPVTRGSKQTYVYEMLVDSSIPGLSTDAIWKMTDYWGFTVACFKADIQIS